MQKDGAPFRAPAMAWVALVILAAAVVPLRVAEIARQHQSPIFKQEKCPGAVPAALQGKAQP